MSVAIVRYTFVQASQLCTSNRAKKVIIGLALVAVSVQCSLSYTGDLLSDYIASVVLTVIETALYAVLPVTVLIINVLLVLEVRRASINAAANLGLHHQSTSSNSAVPTVMVVATSLVYVLLFGTVSITFLLLNFMHDSLSSVKFYSIAWSVSRFIFAYNFYVYLITGKQFRSDLRTLFCRCSSSSSSSSSAAAAAALAHNRNDARLAGRGQAETAV